MEKEINSLGSVYVEKSQLLDIVKKNKEKHDLIFNVALEGYNAAVKNYLEKIESESERVKNLSIEYKALEADGKRFDKTGLYLIDCNLPVYPSNYQEHYDKTIRKLELSTADKISLVDTEFNQYVMNNWSWKSDFLSSNTQYVTGAALFISGCGTAINTF